MNIFLILIFQFLPFSIFSLKCGFDSISNCQTCLSDSSGCSLCDSFTAKTPGYTLLNGLCYPCRSDGSQLQNPGCTKCLGDGKCLSTGCLKGYYFFENLCKICNILNCLECESESKCIVCKTGFVKNENYQCVACREKILNCDICSSDSQCTTCLSSYYLTENKCTGCGANCVTCKDNTECLICGSGYYLKEKLCVPCTVNSCTHCPNDICQKCSSEKGLFFTTYPFKCQACPSNCLQCNYDTNSFKCTKCKDNYYISDTFQCNQCETTCLNCLSATKCNQCKNPFILYQETESKFSCISECSTEDQTKLLIGSICMNCKAKYGISCIKCDENKCLTCTQPFEYQRPITNECVACDIVKTDIIISEKKQCYQSPTANILAINGNIDGSMSITIDCEVPSIIYLVFLLSENDDRIDSIVLEEIEKATEKNVWRNRYYLDAEWKVYARLNTNNKGVFEGFVKANMKLSETNYFVKAYCKSISGEIISKPNTKLFNTKNNQGITTIIIINSGNIVTKELKIVLGQALYQELELVKAMRVLYTDEGYEINSKNYLKTSRILAEIANKTESIIYTPIRLYLPPNWTLPLDEYNINIANRLDEEDFLTSFKNKIASIASGIIIKDVGFYLQDEQFNPPSFSIEIPSILAGDYGISFGLTLKGSNGFIIAGILQIDGNIKLENSTFWDRIPNYSQILNETNALGINLNQTKKLYAKKGSKIEFIFNNLTSNTSYDIYFVGHNDEFPFTQRTAVFGRPVKTSYSVFGSILIYCWISIFSLILIFS